MKRTILITLLFTLLYFSVNAQSPGGVNDSLKAWYKADAGVQNTSVNATNGQTVDAWLNQAGSYNLAQPTTTKQPVFYSTAANQLINYNPSLRFDGTDDCIGNATRLMPKDSSYAFFIVALDSATDVGYNAFFSSHTVLDYFSLYKNNDNLTDNSITPYGIVGSGDRGTFGKGTSYGISTGAYWNGTNFTRDEKVQKAQTQIVGMRSANKLATDTMFTYTDGYKSAPIPFWSYINQNAASTGRDYHFGAFVVGADATSPANSAEHWVGNIAEVIAYDRNITDAEANKIQSYLAIKYGITLGQGNGFINQNGNNFNYVASNGTVIWDGTANTTYAYDIFGIGQDNTAGLNQKQSKSINGGFQPAISLNDGLATSNTTNTNIFAADNSFLVAGHNGADVDFTNMYTPITFSSTTPIYILDRVWKVQETGTVGTVTVSFPTTTASTATSTYLVINNVATFGAGTTEILMTSDGNGNLTAQYDFQDGDYFTIVQPLFAPGCVSANLLAWYKADAGVVGGPVSTWEDQTVPAYNLQQPTAGSRPTTGALMNFNPTLTFDANYYLTYQAGRFISTTSPGTVFGAANNNIDAGGYENLADLGIDNPHMGIQNSTMMMYMNGSSPIQVNHANTITKDINQVYGWSWNGGSNAGSQLRLDGILNDFPTTDFTLVGNGGVSDGMFSVGSYQGVEIWNGDIAEVILYDRNLTEEEKQRVETYMALRYGTTLSHNYLSGKSDTIWYTGGGYDNNIAGIGREDCQLLLQKQSQSTNTTNVITIYNGDQTAGLPTDNVSNTSAFSTNESFMVWGDNGSSTSYGVSYSPNTFSNSSFYHMSRIWNVQETGTVGTVTIKAPANAEYLLVHNSADFSTGTPTEIPLVDDGNGNLLATVDLTDGQYFTFGAAVTGPGCVTANLLAWYKADAGVIGNPVSSWEDQTLTPYNLSQTTVGSRPTADSLMNFNPTLTFDALKYLTYQSTRFITTTSSGTVFGAANNNIDNGGYENLAVLGIDNPHMGILNNQMMLWMNGSSPNPTYHSNSIKKDINQVYGWAWNGGTNGGSQMRLDGTLNDFANTDFTLVGNGGVSDGMFSVGSYQGVEIWNGDIAEVILYDRNLTELEKQRVETYLAIRYGTTLSHNYLSGKGDTIWLVGSGYDNNIAGIGREDCQSLLQKQSQSTNTTNVITIYNDNQTAGLPTDNASNTSTFTDESFMIWGDNGAAATYGVNYTLNSFSGICIYHMNRIWNVQETGSVGTVTVQAPANAQYLLVHNSDDFSTGTPTEIPLVDDGNGNLLATVDFTDGQFFTFAGTVYAPGGVGGNLAAWYKANDINYENNGDTIGLWKNSVSGSTYNVATTTATYKPIFYNTTANKLVNNNPSIEFDGTDDRLENTTRLFPSTDGFEMLAVGVQQKAKNSPSEILGMGGGNIPAFGMNDYSTSGWLPYMAGGGAGWYGSNAILYNGFAGGNNQQAQIYSMSTPNGGAANNIFSNVDGYREQTDLVANGVTNTSIGDGVDVGNTGGEYFKGLVNEVIIYNRKLDSVELLKVNSYLAIKYGITLDQRQINDYIASNGTSLYAASTYGAYDHDIAGIGIDSCSSLIQLKSTSANEDAVVTMTADTANVTNFEFLLWANNDSALTLNTTNLPTIDLLCPSRLERIWHTQETGDVGLVDLDFNLNKLPYKSSLSDWKLLIRNGDDDMSGATVSTIIPILLNDSTVRFEDVSLSNDDYFTLAGNSIGPGGVLSNLVAWYKAGENVLDASNNQITTNGGSVSTWKDAIGKRNLTNHPTQGVNKPTLMLNDSLMNNNPALYFAYYPGSVSRILYNSTRYFDNTSAFQLISVAKDLDAPANVFRLKGFMGMGSTGDYPTFDFNGATAPDNSTGNYWTPYLGGSSPFGDYNSSFITYNGTNGGTNQQSQIFGSSSLNTVGGTNNVNSQVDGYSAMMQLDAAQQAQLGNQLYVGNSGGLLEEDWHGLVGEILIYDRVLTAAEQLKVNSYLAIKYGITLDQRQYNDYTASDGTVVYAASTYGAYNHDIAGIGVDTCSGLIQKQSKSVNIGFQPAVSLNDGLATSNSANMNSFDANNSYWVAGHNGQDTTFTEAYTSQTLATLSCMKIMDRKWKVEETGSIGNVTITIPDITTATITAIYLVIDSTGNNDDFTANTTEILMTDAGAGLLSAQYDFVDGQYYSFAYVLAPIDTFEIADTICATSTYLFNEQELNTSGVYLDTIPRIGNCDSIVRLTLTVVPQDTFDIADTICSNETYTFGALTLNTTGVYLDTIERPTEVCDSIVRLTLTVIPQDTFDIVDTICATTTDYTFGGLVLTESGIYLDTIARPTEYCDSIVRLTLTVVPQDTFEISASICTGQTYSFGGMSLNATGVYLDTILQPTKPCDSIVRLTLTVVDKDTFDIVDTICSIESYSFDGMLLNITGVYFKTVTRPMSCDSIVRLTLTVIQQDTTDISATICSNENYSFDGMSLNTTGVYLATIARPTEVCDSIVRLTLTVVPQDTFDIADTICSNETYTFGALTLNTTGVYLDTIERPTEVCDSIVRLTLTVIPQDTFDIADTICATTTDYTFGGLVLTESGIYLDTIARPTEYCDSIVRLTLTVVPQDTFEISASICTGQTYSFGGMSLNATGVYLDTILQPTKPCDSIVRLTLTVVDKDTFDIVDTICSIESYSFDGMLLNITGVYFKTVTRPMSCDSIVRLTLTVIQQDTTDISATICSNENYSFDGMSLNTTGVYLATIARPTEVCDSIVRLTLTVVPQDTFDIADTICSNETYTFGALTLNTTGVYLDTIERPTEVCDSIVRLTLTVIPQDTFDIADTICATTTDYTFGGLVLTESGIYLDTIARPTEYCDSIVRLTLTVVPQDTFEISASICTGQTYSFGGMSLNATGVYLDTILQPTKPCDSIVRLTLTVVDKDTFDIVDTICSIESYSFDGMLLNITGVYFKTVTRPMSCDSIVRLTLTVIQQDTTDISATICSNENYSFDGMSLNTTGVYLATIARPTEVCDSIVRLTLTVVPQDTFDIADTICSNETYTFGALTLNTTGVYLDTIERPTEVCDSIVRLTLTVIPQDTFDISDTICATTTDYTFGGLVLTESGIYLDTIARPTEYCDSIVRLTLTVVPQDTFEIAASICTGQTYSFGGMSLNATGVYLDTILQPTKPCDSIVRLTLIVDDYIRNTENVTLCYGDSIIMCTGNVYKTAGAYNDTCKTTAGCDSITTTIITLDVCSKDTVPVIDVCDTCTTTVCLDTIYDITNGHWTLCDGSQTATSSLGSYTIDSTTGCITYTANGAIGRDTLCILICDSAQTVCDSQTVVVAIIPSTETITDTIEIGTTDSICVAIEDGMTPDNVTIVACDGGTLDNITTPTYTINGNCVMVTYTGTNIGTDEVCVIICDTDLDICDTNRVVITVTTQDTVPIIEVPCDTCTVTVCLDTIYDINNGVWTLCDGTQQTTTAMGTYGIDQTSGCVTYTGNGIVGRDTLCIVVCDATQTTCDTIKPVVVVLPTNDTITDSIAIGVTDSICVPIEDGMTPDNVTIVACDGGTLDNITTPTYTINGNCVMVTYTGTNIGTDEVCVIICDTDLDICDTNRVVITVTTQDTVPIIEVPCDTCTVTVCLDTIYDINNGVWTLCDGTQQTTTAMGTYGIDQTSGCVTYTGNGIVGRDTLCIVVCDATQTTCDTIKPVVVVLPTNDTITDSIAIGVTDSICVPIEDGMTPDNVTIVACDGGTLDNITTPTYTINGNCVMVTYTGTNIGTDEVCVIICDTDLDMCDTNRIVITVTTQDTVPIIEVPCDTCTVTVCLDTIYDINNGVWTLCDGTQQTTTAMGTYGIDQTTGCVTYTGNGIVGRDTLCIVVCDATLSTCDTIHPVVVVLPTTETITDTIKVGATDSICIPIENGMTADYATIVMCNGTLDNITLPVVTSVSATCVTITYTGTSIGTDDFCVVVCDVDLAMCDTTKVSITVIAKDTIPVIEVCDTCTETVCLDTIFDITDGVWTLCDGSQTTTSGLGTYSIDATTGCVTYTANGIIGQDTLCIVVCDATQTNCDTIEIIIDIVCSERNSVYVDTTICSNKPIVINGQTISTAGTYEIHYTANNSCDSIVMLTVTTVDCSCDIAKGISPNGDGMNDYLDVECLKLLAKDGVIRFRVYNRWGIEVYRNDNYNSEFNGIYKGEELPDGTYYYILEYTNLLDEDVNISSYLTIFR
ncbi:MAG: gliding motility-associated C-terminal domain-containing protein [Chitinophagales bacterium]|nr:gliding motility-associated C-terminal domain-containing protein [Chitinophagales bacterium]